MKLVALAAALSGFVFLGTGPAGEALRFQPEEGSRVTKSFAVECGIVLDSLGGEGEGVTVDASAFGIPVGATAGFAYAITCSDEYASVAGGRPTELLRTYDRTDFWTETLGVREDEGEEDALLGKTVRFVWNEEDEVYERSWVGEEGPEADLARWSAELDLLALLPPQDVGEGERWTVRGPALWNVILAGFDFEQALEQGLAEAETPEAVADALEELVNESVAELVWNGVREDDGDLGEIVLAFETERSLALDPSLIELNEEAQAEVTSFEITLELELDGTLLWNLAAGRFESFELEGDGSVVLEFAATVKDVPLDFRAELSLELAQDAKVEPR